MCFVPEIACLGNNHAEKLYFVPERLCFGNSRVGMLWFVPEKPDFGNNRAEKLEFVPGMHSRGGGELTGEKLCKAFQAEKRRPIRNGRESV